MLTGVRLLALQCTRASLVQLWKYVHITVILIMDKLLML